MKSWILLIVVVAGISAAATVAVPLLTADAGLRKPGIAAPSSRPDGPAPALNVDGSLTHNFGHMAQNQDGKHTWVFRNDGPGPLELRTLSSTCSCTLAQLGKNSEKFIIIEPGQSGPIDLTWQTKQNNGSYRQSATIGTNDPNRPEIVLTVEGTVQPAIVTVPGESSINFGSVSNEQPHTNRVALFSGDRPDFKIVRLVSSNPDRLKVEAGALSKEECETLKATAGHSVQVTLLPTPHLGAFAEEIMIETDHPLRKEVRFTVLGKTEGPIIVTPASGAILHNATTRDGGSIDLTLWCRGQSQTKFTVAKKPDHVGVAIEPVGQAETGKNSKYRMTVSVEPSSPAGKIKGEIVLSTDNPNASEVKVPVDILVRSSN
ncbi:DUF1573 domain-containing protein [Tundrisphaera sp. TA3]|uniref:DUF1573 domain-containing protein n=1 Tax=Tundrisphaera sp. TA3 TaxID=3435775 RepID=UPI003EBBCFE7